MQRLKNINLVNISTIVLVLVEIYTTFASTNNAINYKYKHFTDGCNNR